MTELGVEGHPGQVRVVRRRPRGDARRHRAVQDVHARRRRRHEHLRPGPAVLLGHPGDHAERPDARAVQVRQGDATRTRRPSASSAGTSASRTTASSRRTSSKKIADAGYEFNGLYELVPVGGQDFSAGAAEDQGQRARHPARQHLRPGPGLVRRPGADRRPDARCGSASSSRPTASTPRRARTTRDGCTFAYDYFDAEEPGQPAGQAVRARSSTPSTARTPTSTPPTSTRTRFVMWEVMRRVLAERRRHQRRRRARRRPAGEPHRRQRLRRRREHGRHLHARPDDPLGDQARDGRVRVQGRRGHPAGVLRHRRRGLPHWPERSPWPVPPTARAEGTSHRDAWLLTCGDVPPTDRRRLLHGAAATVCSASASR